MTLNHFDIIPDKVSIIIPTITRNKFQDLKTFIKKRFLINDCLNSIQKNVSESFEVIVICNSSSDRNLIDLINNHKVVNQWSINKTNIGVPRSWNQGAQLATGEYLCFMNDDVELGKDAITKMKTWLNDDKIGQVGPKGTEWRRKEPGKYLGLNKPETVDAISGWLFMTKTSIFRNVGGIDIYYTPAFMEEIDFSFAIRNTGYKCIVDPSINAIHHHISGASSTNKPIEALGESIQREELTQRNRIYFEKKWDKFWK